MIELAVFDMAGTTIDEHGEVYRALETCVVETGVEVTAEDLQTWMGADKTEAITALIELGGGQVSDDVVRGAFDRFRLILSEAYEANPPQPLDGVEKAFETLRSAGIKIALTTGFTADVAGPLLEGLGWRAGENGTVDAVVTSDEVPAGRPAPYMIFRAMEKTGVQDVRRVISTGDTAVDLQSAANAGVVGVGVLTGKATREDLEKHPHQHIVDGSKDVPRLVEQHP